MARKRQAEQEITTTELKARCLSVIDYVSRSGRSVVITKYGKPLVRIVPITSDEGEVSDS